MSMLPELETLLEWASQGRRVALATVIETWGSAPRPVGSQLVADGAGNFAGSVSGGCVEAAVIAEAAAALADGRPRDLSYGVSNESAWAVGLACGGKLRVYVEPVDEALVQVLAAVIGQVGERRSCLRPVPIGAVGRELVLAGPLLDSAGMGLFTTASGEIFHQLYAPPPRLIIVGAVHIAQFLAPMARMAGFEVRLVDPRDAFASPARFPDFPIERTWPDEALNRLGIDALTAVVTLTHDGKLDDPALLAALPSPAFHVAALGSRTTQAARLDRLRQAGLPAGAVARLRAPAGLPIGAATPSEIAVSILAEIIESLRQPPKEASCAA